MKKVLLTAVAVMLFAGTASAAFIGWENGTTRAEWTWEDPTGYTHEYQAIYFNRITWDNAQNAVNAMNSSGPDVATVNEGADQLPMGWYLATITTMEEQSALAENMGSLKGEYWLGGVQPYQSDPVGGARNDWSWDTGEGFCFTCWGPGEPNEWGGELEDHIGTWSRYQWNWNDEHKDANIRGFIVERGALYDNCAPIPEPATILLFGTGMAGLMGFRLRRRK